MRNVVITGGPDIHYDRLRAQMRSDDYVICADSGAAHARVLGLIPQKLIGDLDSIDAETLMWIRDMKVPLEVYPVEKDMTDTELCLRSIAAYLPVLLISSFGGRPDHVLSNYLLAGRLAAEGRRLIMTDGVTYVYPVAGPDVFELPGNLSEREDNFDSTYISLIPLFDSARGVTTQGLAYALSEAELLPGSTFSVSNKANKNTRDITIRVAEGVLLVVVTPES